MDKREIISWIKTIALALIVGFLIKNFVFTIVEVNGISMEPTLKEGQRIFVNRIGLRLGNPDRGDIIVFKDSSLNIYIIKRVIGLPGDTIRIEKGTIYINEVPLKEDYVAASIEELNGVTTVPSGSYFLIGDNRLPMASYDSRYFGPIDGKIIIGKAEFQIFPRYRQLYSN